MVDKVDIVYPVDLMYLFVHRGHYVHLVHFVCSIFNV
jgi:hypothetical protein